MSQRRTTLPNQQSSVVWTASKAIGVAEGYIEASSTGEVMEAWSYLLVSGLHTQLQGFFGRRVAELIDRGLLDTEGNINWDLVEELDEQF
jgi:hypothetical protein